ncbi:MAG TPA: hypothetical protein VFZ09_36385 [Archangium sp.]|uniref:Acg family FMN-binding oxidoreductase n=1 Tax=Archangium sp. TaxID=1872627 RepID=UPI002E3241D0|nr:hypothetical protein [Archangium sp.]HEX5751755.1 hypothetical protein [Archangium sp.]
MKTTAPLSRRALLRAGGGAALLLMVDGCGYYAEGSGEAYAPWKFPDGETRPEWLAVRAALLAASPHNTQPWLFSVSPQAVDVFAALERNLGPMDSLRRELHIGLGCAVENLVRAARANGREATVAWMPEPADATHVARVTLQPAAPRQDPLYDALARRHTHRGVYVNGPLPAGVEQQLQVLVDEPDVRLFLLTSSGDMERFRTETVRATRAIVEDTEMHDAGDAWVRYFKEELERNRDGATIDATGLDWTTRSASKLLARPDPKTSGQYWIQGTEARQLTGSAFGILATRERNDRIQQMRGGRVYQRLHLYATSVGLSMQPLCQLPERQDREEQLGLASDFGHVLGELTGPGWGVQMAFRMGVSWDEPLLSPRRPLEWVTR